MTNATITEPYKLMRARSGRMLGGVAAGLAQASGLDVTVVRICIGATMLSGFGIPAYILMWIVLPEEAPRRGRVIEAAPENTARIIRIAIVGLAVMSMLNRVGGFFSFTNPNRGFGLDGVVGLVLLGIGISILFSRHRPDRDRWDAAPPPAPRSTVAPPRPADDGSYYFDDEGVDPDEEPPTFAGPFSEVAQTMHGALSQAFDEMRTTLRESRPNRSSRPYSTADAYDDDPYDEYDASYAPRPLAGVISDGKLESSGGAALGWARVIGWFALIWWTIAGIACTALWFFGGVSVTAPILLAGTSWFVFMAVSSTLSHAKFARAIMPSLVLLLLPIGIALATVRPIGEWGHHIHHPSRVEKSELNYRQSFGRMDVDLGDTRFTETVTTVNARMGGGAIFVTVPDDAKLVVNARARAGDYDVLGRKGDGMRQDKTMTFEGCETGPTLNLNLRTGGGYIEVERESGNTKAACG